LPKEGCPGHRDRGATGKSRGGEPDAREGKVVALAEEGVAAKQGGVQGKTQVILKNESGREGNITTTGVAIMKKTRIAIVQTAER